MIPAIRKHGARIYAVAVSVVLLTADYLPDLPVERVLGLVLAVLSLLAGEAVQRAEDKKTLAALASQPVHNEDEVKPKHRKRK